MHFPENGLIRKMDRGNGPFIREMDREMEHSSGKWTGEMDHLSREMVHLSRGNGPHLSRKMFIYPGEMFHLSKEMYHLSRGMVHLSRENLPFILGNGPLFREIWSGNGQGKWLENAQENSRQMVGKWSGGQNEMVLTIYKKEMVRPFSDH